MPSSTTTLHLRRRDLRGSNMSRLTRLTRIPMMHWICRFAKGLLVGMLITLTYKYKRGTGKQTKEGLGELEIPRGAR